MGKIRIRDKHPGSATLEKEGLRHPQNSHFWKNGRQGEIRIIDHCQENFEFEVKQSTGR
jgi:hypothetical protein